MVAKKNFVEILKKNGINEQKVYAFAYKKFVENFNKGYKWFKDELDKLECMSQKDNEQVGYFIGYGIRTLHISVH